MQFACTALTADQIKCRLLCRRKFFGVHGVKIFAEIYRYLRKGKHERAAGIFAALLCRYAPYRCRCKFAITLRIRRHSIAVKICQIAGYRIPLEFYGKIYRFVR